MEVLLLGPVHAQVAGRPVNPGSPQHRLVLAVLALEVNRLVPVDRLVELVWPVSPPRTAEHAVQVAVSRLRQRLGIDIARQGTGYVLRADPMTVDVHRFTALVERARRETDDRARAALLDAALALWTGPALSGTSGGEQTRDRLCLRLEETRLTTVEDRLDTALRLGEHQRVLAELAALVAEHPARERLVGQHMLALYRSGRAGDALLLYQRTRRLLADDLGLDPGAELRRLELAILRGEVDQRPPSTGAGKPRRCEESRRNPGRWPRSSSGSQRPSRPPPSHGPNGPARCAPTPPWMISRS